ncbi:hypothetical protein [Cryptosporangium japonicum]|uniref:Uncharacterized protein n=1 Tax=Cryptosporangium japonicum TaxID=80872 RepID=A0ABP3E4N9_9ACTN
MGDRIAEVTLSAVTLPTAISDAKVLTARPRPDHRPGRRHLTA